MAQDLIIYLSEEMLDRLNDLIKDKPEFVDIYNELGKAEYCECDECTTEPLDKINGA